MGIFSFFNKTKKITRTLAKCLYSIEDYDNLAAEEKFEKSKELFESNEDDETLDLSMCLLVSSANDGFVKAECQLGIQLLKGEFIEQNYENAFKYLNLASQKGNLDAKWNIAYMFQNGFGVTQDNSKAFQTYLELAEVEYPMAMTQVGLSYLSGEISEIDEDKAIHWLKKACDKNDIDALVNLGNYYYNKEMDKESYILLSKAYRLGSEEARNLLEDEVYDSFR